jgi:hypothetical protein
MLFQVAQYTRRLLGQQALPSTAITSNHTTQPTPLTEAQPTSLPSTPTAIPTPERIAAGTDTGNVADSSQDTQGLEEKRVRNTKLKHELGVSFKFPTYREGMAALVTGDLAPFSAEDLAWLKLQP